MPDHVHMLVQIPPKYAVSQVVGYIKGKSAIHLARVSVTKDDCPPSKLLYQFAATVIPFSTWYPGCQPVTAGFLHS
jgi:REP element-mobilizing transposase RayT